MPFCARHDFFCPTCHVEVRNHIGATPISDPTRNPNCSSCGDPMTWIPQARFSGFSDSDATAGRGSFAKTSIPVEDPGAPGGFRQETIGSLADIRRLERESEQRERNHEGRRMVWRDYSQDGNNRDQHTLGADPSIPLSKTLSNGAPVTVRRGDRVTTAHGTLE